MKSELPTKEAFTTAYQNSVSINQVAKHFGLSWTTARNLVIKFGLTLPTPIKQRSSSYTADEVREQYLSNKYSIESSVLRHLLIKTGIKEPKCEICGLEFWRGKRIPLDLHHKNGNHYDNSEDNLMILCPTCHATLTRPQEVEERIQFNIQKDTNAPRAASDVHGKKFNCSATELLQAISTYGTYRKVGELYGVTDNAIRKRCGVLGILDLVQPIINQHKRLCALQNRRPPTDEQRAAMSAAAKQAWENKESPYAKPVDCIDRHTGGIVKTYKSIQKAIEDGFSRSHITACCNGSRILHKGYRWQFHTAPL